MRGSRLGERRGGRQRGTKNKRTQEREKATAAASAKIADVLGSVAFVGDAHALLMSVYKDIGQPLSARIDAAKAALPFEKPRLSTVDAKIERSISLADLVNGSYRPDLPEIVSS
jgi:type II secretory pathway component PulM